MSITQNDLTLAVMPVSGDPSSCVNVLPVKVIVVDEAATRLPAVGAEAETHITARPSIPTSPTSPPSTA